MKTIKKCLFIGMLSLSMAACADLDLNPLSEGSSENWYHDETEIEMSLNDLWRPDFFPIDDIDWDDDMLNRNGSNDVTAGTITSQWGTSSTRWNSLYKAIARATKVIKSLDKGSASGLTESKIDQYRGEAYFMLGFAYCELATYWGDCVLNKDMTLEEAYEAVRSPKSEVLAYAYECLDKAIELLPASYKGQQRPTKGAALGFKARFALYHNDWETAAQAAEECMNLQVYSLHDNYAELFKADVSPELMFYFKGDLLLKKGYGLFTNIKDYVLRKYGGFANRSPSLELFCAYTCTDGLPIDESPLYNPKDPFANRDPRLAMTIQPFKTKYSADYAEYEQSKIDGTFPEKYPDYIFLGYEYNPNPYATKVYEVSTGEMVINTDGKAANQHSAYNGLMMRKFVKDNWKDFNSNGNVSDNCYPYLRYAEVLMTYVEAKNELGTCTQEDLDKTINLIRERAYRGSGIAYPVVKVASKEELRKAAEEEPLSIFLRPIKCDSYAVIDIMLYGYHGYLTAAVDKDREIVKLYDIRFPQKPEIRLDDLTEEELDAVMTPWVTPGVFTDSKFSMNRLATLGEAREWMVDSFNNMRKMMLRHAGMNKDLDPAEKSKWRKINPYPSGTDKYKEWEERKAS